MPSLKDLRNRIGSVKATRKITKAMQMVAAAKLRRAQEAATAARPYAQRMDRVLANLNKRANRAGASPLLVGTGKDETHLLIVMTAERGLCGGFNSNIARLARADAARLTREGKAVKLLCVGRKGADLLRREYGRQILERVDLKGVKQVAFANAHGIANRLLALFEAGAFDVATLYFSEFKSVIAQKPTAQQLISVKLPEATGAGGAAKSEAVYEYEPEENGDPELSPAAQHLGADLPRVAGERRLRAGRAHERHGQRHAQRRRDDRQADTCATTARARPTSPRS